LKARRQTLAEFSCHFSYNKRIMREMINQVGKMAGKYACHTRSALVRMHQHGFVP
jgi:hypothetical protein